MMEVVENVFTLTVRVLTQTAEFFLDFIHFNVNTFFKWVPTSKSRVAYDLDIRHRHHNAQNYWSSGEPPLPRYACIYPRYI